MGLSKLKTLRENNLLGSRGKQGIHTHPKTGGASSQSFHKKGDCPTLLKDHVTGIACALNIGNKDVLTLSGETAQWL